MRKETDRKKSLPKICVDFVGASVMAANGGGDVSKLQWPELVPSRHTGRKHWVQVT